MGAFLEKPKTEKVTGSGEGKGLKFGVSAMQGWRMEMEDAHVCNTEIKTPKRTLDGWAFFGVFDGHAGAKVSQYCAEHLLNCIVEHFETDKEDNSLPPLETTKEGIIQGFLGTDKKLREEPQWSSGEDRSGTTAITVMITPTHIIWGNCGDSRGLLCRSGKLHYATEDHKPYNATEKDRIERAGGTVMMQRVNGSLAVSRALGDFDYKRCTDLKPNEQLVSPEPDISVNERDGNDEFLFLACDGIFDVMTNEEVIAYISRQLTLTDNLAEICSNLLDLCLHKNSRDNMSAILVTFPSAPKVSQEAIDSDKKLQEEARVEIEKKIQEYVENAKDSLDVDEPYVMQQLINSLPAEYEVASKRPWISEQLQELRKKKFNDDLDNIPDVSGSNPLYEQQERNLDQPTAMMSSDTQDTSSSTEEQSDKGESSKEGPGLRV